MSLEFEWDARKGVANQRKHGVGFEEAASVFGDPHARVFDDEFHSSKEFREIILGRSDRGRWLVMVFTERGGRLRIISARRATKRERKDYEENQTG